MSKAEVCSAFVIGVTEHWTQTALELKDGTPVLKGTLLPFSSTPEDRKNLKIFVNGLNPLFKWIYPGGQTHFPGTRNIKSAVLRCQYTREPRESTSRKKDTRTKRCGCTAGINIYWESPDSKFCGVRQVDWEHIGHHPPAGYDDHPLALNYVDLTPETQQCIISAYVALPQNPVQTDASEIAKALAGVYVTRRAVRYMLDKAKEARDKRDTEKDKNKLLALKELRRLALTPESIQFRDSGKSNSENLICALKKLYLDFPGFRYILEFGMPTLDTLFGSCGFDTSVSDILSNQAQGFFQRIGAHTYVTESECQQDAGPSGPSPPDPVRVVAEPPLECSPLQQPFDPRLVFDDAISSFKLPCGTVLPHSTLLAALATPRTSSAMYVKQDTSWNRKGRLRHAGWRLVCDGRPLSEGSRKALQGDAAFQNTRVFIENNRALTGNATIRLLPGSPYMLCEVGTHKVGTQADQLFVHVASGQTGVWEFHPTSKPSKNMITAVKVPTVSYVPYGPQLSPLFPTVPYCPH